MALVNQFDQASAGSLNETLAGLSNQGQAILDELLAFRQVTLLRYAAVQSYINSRRILAGRHVGQRFTLSVDDFAYIDQGNTTGSVRADAGVVTTKENNIGFRNYTKLTFSSSSGNIVPLDQANQTFRVISDLLPTGQFDIELDDNLSCNLITFDVLTSPGNNTYTVSVSDDKLNYTVFPNTSINGYRVTSFGPSTNTKYVRIVVKPAFPDLLAGNNYSFGVTSLVVRGSEFALRSAFNSRAFTVDISSDQVFFGGEEQDGLTYYVSFSQDGTGEYLETDLNSNIKVPGVTGVTVTTPATLVSGKNVLGVTLPNDYFPNTLKVTETIDGNDVVKVLLPQLSFTDPNLSNITKDCILLQGNQLILLTPNALDGRSFKVSYYSGPTTKYQAKVRVVLDSTNHSTTPMFKQVYFEAV